MEDVMSIQFFTNAERERLNRFPAEIQYQDLVTFFTLSEADRDQIPVCSAIHNRLGFALQLCTLRFMGFVPDDLQSIPPAVVEYVARQLNTIPDDLAEYGTRDQTRTEHLQKILDLLFETMADIPTL
jgi:TnpA family transposase